MEIFIIIFICLLLIGGVFDWVFGILGWGMKVIAAVVLIFACIYLGIKMFITMIPWMFGITVIAFIFGLIWLIRTIAKHD